MTEQQDLDATLRSIMLMLMQINATLEAVRDLLASEEDVTKKSLTPDEIARLRALVEDVRDQVRELIAFLEARLGGKPG